MGALRQLREVPFGTEHKQQKKPRANRQDARSQGLKKPRPSEWHA